MRVICVLSSLDPAFGGPSVSAPNSCIAVRRAGVHTIVAVPVDAKHVTQVQPVLEKFCREGIEVRTFSLIKRLHSRARRWAVSWDLAKWLRSAVKESDLVHCHSAWTFSSVVAMMAARQASKPVLLSPHESLAKFDLNGANTYIKLVKHVLKRVYAWGLDRVIFSSPLELKDSLTGLDSHLCSFVYHAVYDERMGVQQIRDRSTTDQGLKIGFLARLHPKKNLELLIQALPQLPKEVVLVVAGSGPEPYEKDLQRLAEREEVVQRIHTIGFISEEQKPGFFRSIDVLAMPSAYECFGMSAAEAMLHGVPVIVSTETGIADVVKQYGCGIVVQAETGAVTQAITSLWRARSQLAEMSAQAIQAATQQFSFAVHGANLRCQYENVLAASARADGGEKAL